jgi:hypothetical protein
MFFLKHFQRHNCGGDYYSLGFAKEVFQENIAFCVLGWRSSIANNNLM